MADDIDSGLSVNFVTSKNSNTFRKDRQKEKVRGNRGQRIKFRKAEKHFKKTFGNKNDVPDEIRQEFKGNTVHSDKDKPKKDAERTGPGVAEKKKTGEVVSSLFRHNPEIPALQSAKIDTVKEKLFTSDSFQEAPLHPYMVSNLEKLGYSKMTSVQQETIPKLVKGHDLLVRSQTGSGKTMAYAIPIIEDLCRHTPKIQRSDGTRAVVLVPTRELAIQSFEVFQKLLKPFTWLVPGCIMGGEKRKGEKARLRKGVNILIATPGRMIDHIENTQNLLLDRLKWLVLDEADRLLDMGFEEKVSKIVAAADKQSPDRQTVLLSATLTDGVERLAGMSLKDPQTVSIGQEVKKPPKPEPSSQPQSGEALPSSFALPESLKQYFVITPCKLRLVTLLTLILTKCKKGSITKMIVFLSTQDSVEFHYRLVHYLASDHSAGSDVEEGQQATSLDLYRLHGDMAQKDRTASFQEFCSVRAGVLLCTDVAARGLHLPAVQWVVQYSCSTGAANYVHRVGRTARAGTKGTSLMFVMPSEVSYIQHLNQHKISIDEMKLGDILQDIVKLIPMLPGIEDSQRQMPKTAEETATYLQNCCENHIKNDKTISALSRKAFQSYVRGYATYPHDLKSIFHVRHLHLGHVAKTFGLREAPSNITGVAGLNKQTLLGKRKGKHEDTHGSKVQRKNVSEFGGPLVFKQPAKKSSKSKQTKVT